MIQSVSSVMSNFRMKKKKMFPEQYVKCFLHENYVNKTNKVHASNLNFETTNTGSRTNKMQVNIKFEFGHFLHS